MSARTFGIVTCVALFLGLQVVASSAHADLLSRVKLQWRAPASCPDVAFVLAQLRRDLEGSQSSGEALDVRAVVEQDKQDEWRVAIRTQSALGVSDRSLFAHSCEALADATSLIVAMQIDPETAAIHARVIDGLTEPIGAAQLPTVARGEPRVAYPGQLLPAGGARTHSGAPAGETKTIARSPEDQVSGNDAARSRVRGLLGVSVQRDWGSLPSGSEIFTGALGVVYGPLWGELGAGVSSGEDIAQSSAPAIGSVRMLNGALRGCGRVWEHARFGLSPCIGFEWARWSSEGNTNLNTQRTDSIVTTAASLRWVASLRISGNLSLVVPLDVVVPLSRPRFGFVEAAERQVIVFTPYWIALRVGAGVQLYFP